MKIKLVAALLMLLAAPLCAQTPRDFAVDLYSTVSTSSPCITLNWTIRRQSNITAQKVHRRLKGAAVWVKQADLATNQTSFADGTAVPGVEYEYWMERTYTGISPSTAMGYLSSGVNVPMVDSRGILLLVIDSTMVAPLAPEIEQLKADLTGDGWKVQTITATRTDTALNTKALIKAAYDADPVNVKMVYILGHVPVPYSGDIAPDGHGGTGGHTGAWPADGYYGEMNGTWTDTSVNDTSAGDARNRNIPGDGKFDQSDLPSPVELMVGRVDLSNMTRAPASAVSETSLLRRYLRKAHDFRFKQGAYAAIPRRGLVRDGFGYFSGENFAIAGWSWIFTGVTPTQVDEPPSDQWFSASYAGGKSYLVGCGTGGGSWDTAGSVGNSADFGLKTSRVVFTTLFGSYFGDWDSANNFMRAPLAGNATGDSLGLTCFWGGRPNRVTHHMGMGETAGYCMMVSHNSSMTGGGGYTPNIYNGVHCGLMGDPSLRLHAVEPPRNLSASSANTQVALAWAPSAETNLLGYLVYRASTAAGPFTRLIPLPQASTTYTDATVTAGLSYTYLVRTLKLETSPGGTYENPSVGAFVTLAAAAGAGAAPNNPSSLTVAQSSSTNAWLSWTDNASNETGFRIERKTNAGGSFAAIGTVGTSVTNFTDPGPFAHGNVYYYRVVATGSPSDSAPSPEALFEAFAGFFNLPVTRMKVSKTAGSATVTVNRFGGVTGPVSVNFATSDTSAFAGTHYAATNGTLTWADGDTAPKTISVAVINTASPQAARQFKVTLSAPSTGTALTINSSTAVLIEDPTATLGAPWSQAIVNSLTDSSAAVIEAGSISSVTIGGSGLTASSTYEAGQFVYQSFTGDGVLTAYFPAGIPSDGNARYALMVRASTGNNVVMAAAVTSSNTGFGTKLYSRTSAGGYSTETTANTLVISRWVRLIRSGNTFSAETSPDGVTWTSVGTATLASMPAAAVWGIFHTSSDWSVTGLGNYHLLQAQSVTLTAIPAPPAPTGLTAAIASSTAIALSWNSASFASGYRVERRTETNGYATIATLAAASGTNQTYTNTGLDVNTAYAYRVVATNAVGESAPSAPAYAATAADMLVRLTTGDAGAGDAAVQRDLPNTPLGTLTNLTVAGYNSSPYSLLTNAAKTYLRFNLAGVGNFTTAQLRLVALTATNAPRAGLLYLYTSLLEESSDSWSESTITWNNAPQNNLTDYDFIGNELWLGGVYGATVPAAGNTITLDLDSETLSSNRGANNLITIGLYQYYDATEWASHEHPIYAPPTLELIAPTNTPSRASFLTAAPGTGWSIDLGWQDNAIGETGFLIERREGAGAFSELQSLGVNTTGFTDAATQPGVTYTYRVRAFNANGPSDWTPEVTITAATLETARSTIWDGGGADTLFSTATNWDFNTRPDLAGSETLTFATGGSTATVNTNAFLRGIILNRNADFTFAAGGGALALGDGGLRTALPTTTSRAYTFSSELVLATNQTWAVTNNGAGVATVTVAGRISGPAGCGITKIGNGVLSLTASNSYDGVTTVNGGQLAISHGRALGSTNGLTAVRSTSGGYIQLSGNITVPEPLTLNGERPGYQASLLNNSGSNVWSGPITRLAQTRLGSAGGTTLVVAGGMKGTGGSCVINAGGTIAFVNTPLAIGTDQFYTDSGGLTIVGVAGNSWGDTLVAGGTLRMEASNALPAATIMKIGISYSAGGTLDLNGFDQTVGQLRNETVSNGTRVVTSAKPAVLTVNQGANATFDGRLTGALSLVKAGSGALTLSNALSTLSGDVTVREGALILAPATRLGACTNVSVSGGSLTLMSAALTNAAHLSIASGGLVTLSASVTQTVERLYLDGARKGRGTWGAPGSGATYTNGARFAGAGVVFVTSGISTTWDGGGADTAASTPYNWEYDVFPAFDGSAAVTFASGGGAAALDIPIRLASLSLRRDADFSIVAAGGTLTLGSGGIWAQTPAATSRLYTIAAPLSLEASQTWGVTNTGAGTTALVVSGPVSDDAASFGLTKSGNGLLTLSGNSTYDGPTTVAAGGGLRVSHANGLGSAAGGTDVASNGWVEIAGNVAVPEPLTLRDAGAAGALRSLSGTNVWSGPIALAAPTRLRAAAGSRLTIAGGVSGGYDLFLSPDAGGELAVSGGAFSLPFRKISASGEGTVIFGGGGHAYATLEVSGAGMRLRLASPNALSAASVLAVGGAYSAMGTVDLNGFDQTVARLVRGTTSSSSNRIVTSASPATLTVNETSSSPIYFNGHLTGALGLAKGDSGYLSLSGTNNTYTGATTVSGGTLEVGASSRLGFSTLVTVSGGTLRLLNPGALADSATVRIATGGTIHLQSGSDTVSVLYLNGKQQRRGTYGSTASGADYKNNSAFSSGGAGMLNVLHGPESLFTIR